MNAFAANLRRRIRDSGPISVADYMEACTGHYYARHIPFGSDGDFITAPEISQMFGELIGLWAADLWQRAGSPKRLTLIELGPGRGTLMADFLRAAKALPAFVDALEVHFVERSEVLRSAQAERVPSARWHDDIESVPRGAPALVIANDFFDALPIEQWIAVDGNWQQRSVALDGEAFCFAAHRPAPPLPLPARDGKLIETSLARANVARAIAERLAADGGGALIIDYGYEGPAYGDTLQVLFEHQPIAPLERAGEADITAHVDFAALAKTANEAGCHVPPRASQGVFLAALGIEARAAALSKALGPTGGHAIEAAMRRLTAPQAMGELFKVMSIIGAGWPDPAGFAK